MRRSIAAVAVAASATIGGVAGAALGAPTLAGASEAPTGAVSWIRDALSGLVDDGTITQDQADAVAEALDEARPEPVPGRPPVALRLDLPAVVAEALGISEDEVRSALRDGQSLAGLAEGRGVDPQVLIDALVADQRASLDEQVADGALTREQADELLAGAEDRAEAIVTGEHPAFGGLPGLPGLGDGEDGGRPGPWGRGGPWSHRHDDHDDAPHHDDAPDRPDDGSDERGTTERGEDGNADDGTDGGGTDEGAATGSGIAIPKDRSALRA